MTQYRDTVTPAAQAISGDERLFDTFDDFIAGYSPTLGTLSDACAAYGSGFVGVGGNQYYCDGVNLFSQKKLSNSSANGYAVISSYGNSIDNMGSASLSASPSNDVSYFTGAIPAASENLTLNGVIANFLACLYPMRKGNNCGVDGRTLATMVTNETAASTATTRKVLDTTNNNPNVLCWVGGAINDLTSATYAAGVIDETNYQTAVTNIKKLISYIVTANVELALIIPVLGYSTGLSGISGTPPANSGNGTGVRNAILRLNTEIGTYITSLGLSNVIYVNPINVSCDSTGAFLSGYVRSTDGIHPDYWGCYNIAGYLKTILENFFGPAAQTLFPGKNVARNAMMAEVSGGWPTDWAVNINANGSVSNRQIETINGVRWATAVITSTAADSLNFFVKLPFNPSDTANGTIPALNVSVNDKYGIECDLFIEGANGTLIENISLWQQYIRYTKTADGLYLQPTFTFPQNAADVLNHGKLQMKPNFMIQFGDAGSTLNGANCWFAPFAAQTIQGPIGTAIKIGIANYRVVKLS